jgi:hypothetical protein
VIVDSSTAVRSILGKVGSDRRMRRRPGTERHPEGEWVTASVKLGGGLGVLVECPSEGDEKK